MAAPPPPPGPPCSDRAIPIITLNPIPALQPNCGNSVGPLIYPNCFAKHPIRNGYYGPNPHPVCEFCFDNATLLIDSQPGLLFDMTNNQTLISPQTFPLFVPWQINAEQRTGILDPTRRFPITPGWQTRMCISCEAMLQARHYFIRTGACFPGFQAHKWFMVPNMNLNTEMDSCICNYKMQIQAQGSVNALPPRECIQHRRVTWTALLDTRNKTDTWLRNASKLRRSGGKIVQATDLEKKRRVMDGTFRACPCGNDVQPWVSLAVATALLGTAPNVLYCMGCGGYQTRRLPAIPTWPLTPRVGVPGVPITLGLFEKKWSQWVRSLPQIGKTLVSR